jgi:hypothetical protein
LEKSDWWKSGKPWTEKDSIISADFTKDETKDELGVFYEFVSRVEDLTEFKVNFGGREDGVTSTEAFERISDDK